MKIKVEIRDILLFLLVIMLSINVFISLRPQKAVAETFKLDDCITARPEDKPIAYLHVVTH